MDNISDGKSQAIEIESRHKCLIYAGPPSHQLPALAAMIERMLDEGYHRDTLPADLPRQSLLAHQTIFLNETLSLVNPHFVSAGLASGQIEIPSEIDELIASLCRLQAVNS